MSEVYRYEFDENGVCYRQPDAPFVSYDDYASLKAENDRLKAEVERLEHQVNYWRIEAEVDNARWLRCLEDLEKLRKDSQP